MSASQAIEFVCMEFFNPAIDYQECDEKARNIAVNFRVADLGRHWGRCDESSRKRSLTSRQIFHPQAALYAQLHDPHTAC